MARVLRWAFAIVVVLALGGYAAFQVSPWPSVLLNRFAFHQGAVAASQALEKHVPQGIAAKLNEHYDPSDGDAYLDVFYPTALEGGDQSLPTIVWIHGGGWVSGTKHQIGNYAKILAGNGFAVASIDYTLAPTATFPTPVRQANMALGYLAANAKRLHVDPSRLILAGDSGGAHIAAATANTIAAPSYAQALGISPSVKRTQLAGMLLYCGAYTIAGLNLDGNFGGFLRTVLWSFSGTKDFENNTAFANAWIADRVTAAFPPSFISAGNADPLLKQSVAFAKALTQRGVRVDSLFFPSDYSPGLPHEYQFDLDGEAGKTALQRSLQFLKSL